MSRTVPIVMSALAFLLVLIGHHWSEPPGDEGWQAHIFQLLMTVQLPIVALFVLTKGQTPWRRIAPALGLQAGAWAVAFGAAFFLVQ